MSFIVLECTQTYDLFLWGRDEHKVWIPIKEGKAAMSGYAFVPPGNWPELRRRCPERFNVRVLAYDHLDRPKTVTLEELTVMQKYLNDHRDLFELKIGDYIQFMMGPFRELIGRVCKVKGEEARILIGNRYVTQPIALLRHL